MIIYIKEKVTDEELKNASEDIPGYLKFVVDLESKKLRIGGVRHVDSEQLFLDEGSSQVNLWGGGIEIDSGFVDYGSMINIRPPLNNSKDVLIPEMRNQILEVLNEAFSNILKLS